MRPHPWLIVVLVGAAVGLAFAGVSTYDFVQHLDRQVHTLHCSFIPGLNDHGGASGCQVAMMSPYSSVLRGSIWGGIPIALPAMSVFAFILFFAIDLLVTRRKDDPRATAFLAMATALPAATSLGMAVISIGKLGTTCKLCVVIYAASTACIVGAIGLWRRALRVSAGAPRRVAAPARAQRNPHEDPAWVGPSREPEPEPEPEVPVYEGELEAPPASTRFLAGAFAIGVAFVAVPIALYVAMAPDHGRFVGTCGGLVHADDSYGVMVRIKPAVSDGVPALEILDPLCPACKQFEQRLEGASGSDRLDRKAILFPLDSTCNWMVSEATHPGACTVSEAVLCAGDRAPEVIRWAFEEQDRIRAAAKTDPTAAARIVGERFPDLVSCVGSPAARSRLNKSLRWAVNNNIHVLTPQLFIDGVKLCDEDVDLGLDYALRIMLERHDAGTLASAVPAAPPPAPAIPVPAAEVPPTAPAPAGSGAPPSAGSGVPVSDGSAAGSAAAGSAGAAGAGSAGVGSAGVGSAGAGSAGSASGDKPASDAPGSDAGSDAPAGSAAAGDKPEGHKPATHKPVTHKPAGDKPASDKPASEPASEPGDDPGPAPTPAPTDHPADTPADTPGGGTS